MQNVLRRVRGAVGMGAMWAVALGSVGAIPRWVFGINTDAPLPLLFGAFGFVAGITFSGLLALAKGRRRRAAVRPQLPPVDLHADAP